MAPRRLIRVGRFEGGRRRGNARGDGRARTGDPLLAKQVLSQLSYIPVGPGGGPFWIRTRDLTVISRALSPTELKARGEPRCPARAASSVLDP